MRFKLLFSKEQLRIKFLLISGMQIPKVIHICTKLIKGGDCPVFKAFAFYTQ